MAKGLTTRLVSQLGSPLLSPKESTIHQVEMMVLRTQNCQKGPRLPRKAPKGKRRKRQKMILDPKIWTKSLLSTLTMKMMTVEMTTQRQPTSSYLRSSARSNRAGSSPKESAVCFKTAKVLSNAVSRSNRSSIK